MKAKDRIRRWLETADFTGNGCRHSQDTIARACMCSRRTVIRATQELEAEGAITIQRARRNTRICNVYHVQNWNPQRRNGVLNVLESIRNSRLREAECHTEGTATTARPQPRGKDHPSLRAAVNQRCGREKNRKLGSPTTEDHEDQRDDREHNQNRDQRSGRDSGENKRQHGFVLSTTMVPMMGREILDVRSALAALIEDIETFGEPRRHSAALKAAYEALAGGRTQDETEIAMDLSKHTHLKGQMTTATGSPAAKQEKTPEPTWRPPPRGDWSGDWPDGPINEDGCPRI